jgi:hypothetical protein
MRNRLGVVLQGPLKSRGRDGKSLGNPVSSEMVDYDSVQLINWYKDQLDELGIPTVLSTWEGQDTSSVKMDVIKSLPSELEGEPNASGSKYYQALSTLRGIQELTNNWDITHVLKIRSDLQLPLDKLIQSTETLMAQDDDRFWVPYFNTQDGPWTLQDFYFGGRATVVEKTLLFYLETPELHSYVHQDFFWKFAISNSADINVHFFPRFGRPWTRAQQDACRRALGVFSPLSLDVHKNLVWRGTPMGESGVEKYARMGYSNAQIQDYKFPRAFPGESEGLGYFYFLTTDMSNYSKFMSSSGIHSLKILKTNAFTKRLDRLLTRFIASWLNLTLKIRGDFYHKITH